MLASPAIPRLSRRERATPFRAHPGAALLPRPASSGLVLLSALLAIAAWAAGTHAAQALAIAGYFMVSSLIALQAVRTSLRSRALGPMLLAVSVWLYFALEALAGAMETPPFQSPSDLRIALSQFEPAQVGQAMLCVALLQIGLTMGYSLPVFPRTPVSLLAERWDRRSGGRMGLQLLIAATVLIPLVSAFGLDFERGLSVIRRARAGAIEDMFPGLVVNFYWVGLFGSTLLLVDGLIFSRRFGRLKAALGFALSAPLWMTGARHLAMYLILPVVLGWLLTRPARGNLRRIALMSLAAVVLVMSLQLVLAVRSRGWDHLGEVDAAELFHLKPTLQFTSLLFATYLVPEHHPYFQESMTPYFFYHWIPRRIWPDKPIPRSWSYYNDTWVENRKTNVTPSIAGQYYINWSWPGVVLIGVWMGWLTAICDRISLRLDPRKQKLALVSVGLFYAFIFCSFRYYSPYYLQYWIFGSLVMLVLTRRAARRESGAER